MDQRYDQQDVEEFMGELRVALPGAQVLFGFLLTVPFTARFEGLDGRDRAVYLFALLTAALASVLLIAPSAARQFLSNERRDRVLLAGSTLAMTGLAFLGLSLAAVLYLVTDLIYGQTAAFGVGAAALAVVLVLWYALPAALRARAR